MQQGFETLVGWLAAILFFNIGGFPFIVLWLIVAAFFFTIYLRGVNFRLFKHALQIVSGKYDHKDDAGEVSHLQALLSALSATVGLGSITGVSVAVAVGGPGTIFWIVVAGLLGMATKFAEVTLSMCYRRIDADGKVYGGPFQYIESGMRDVNLPRLGRVLALIFAVFCLGGAIGGGNMFQSNQAVKMMTWAFEPLKQWDWAVSLVFALFVFVVLIGSIKRIAKVAEAVVPLKGILYLVCAIVVVVANSDQLANALHLIISEAFTGAAATGGFIGMIAMAFKRASFANEAGLGSAPIAHAAARTNVPVREAAVALLEPFFAAIIAFLTGIMVIITGAYAGASVEDGVLIASKAFETVAPWFSIMLAINVLVFAYSTTIGWSYYGEIAWCFLFGRKQIKLYYVIFATTTFLGGILHFGIILDFSDLLILGMSLPNIVVLYCLRKRIKAEMLAYIGSIKR
ncbi:MAG: amino acid carrier protein [Rickettsiales bacterium]|nr:amino acid carrier protein [Rickettsiales bacterium]